jgi:catabolite regulation protein CreA
MSGSDDNSLLQRSRVMTDDNIYEILSYLTLKQKFRLSHVSKKFSDCVNQSISCQQKLEIEVNFDENEREYDCCFFIKLFKS